MIAAAPVCPRGDVFIHLEIAHLFLQPFGHGTTSTKLYWASGTIPFTDSGDEKYIAYIVMCGHFSWAMGLTVPSSFGFDHLSSCTVDFNYFE